MAPLVCNKCNRKLINKDILKCAKCKKVFDIQCSGRSEKMFQLMTTENKHTWTCLLCRPKSNASNCSSEVKAQINSVTDTQNVTLRKNQRSDRVPVLRSQENLSDIDSDAESRMTILDTSTYSLPNMSASDDQLCNKEDELSSITSQLASAHEEVERLNSEISELRKKMNEQQKKIEIYKKLLTEKGPLRRLTPMKHIIRKNNLAEYIDSDDDTPQLLSPVLAYHSHSALKPSEGGTLSNEPEEFHLFNEVTQSGQPDQQTDKGNEIISKLKQSKLCIVSGNKSNKIVSIMEDSYLGYSYCHHLIPGVGIRTLLQNLNSQLKGYTKRDVCVIVIGEKDFRKTEDYLSLVQYSRETLKKVQHTNIILCMPTYICGAPVYNCRVELFNSLLNLDTQTHKYAICFDSNCDLSFNMFSSRTGKIMNSGIRNIFENVKNIIQDIIPKKPELIKSPEVFQFMNRTNVAK